MKDLFNPTHAEALTQRIQQLTPTSPRQWGSMTLSKTLAHCTAGLEMATGIIRPKRATFLANLIGPLIKPFVFRDDQPMRRNSPSSPELFLSDPTPSDFEQQRSNLIAAIETFTAQGPTHCTSHPHPFFGPLTPQQWAILMHKHIDHHLRQFNA